MEDPVTIETGSTYERSQIKQYFDALKTMTDMEDNPMPLRCPVNMVVVDNPDMMMTNENLRKEIEAYNDKHPWAFDYNPKQPWIKINVWD